MIDPKIKSILNSTVPVGRDRNYFENRVIDSFDWRSYYSGCDVRFEIDGIPIEEVAGISFKVVEPVKPHYGYASYVRLKTTRGSRIIQGQIVFNYKDTADLYYLLHKIKTGETPDNFIARPQVKTNSEVISLVELVKKGELSPEDAKKALMKSGTASNLDVNSLFSNKPSKEVMRAFRDKIWGITSESKIEPNLGPSNPYREPLYKSKYNGFNLRIIYGEPDLRSGIYNKMPTIDSSRRQIGTVRLLKGVEISSEYQEISETGEPIRTIYEFMAADIL